MNNTKKLINYYKKDFNNDKIIIDSIQLLEKLKHYERPGVIDFDNEKIYKYDIINTCNSCINITNDLQYFMLNNDVLALSIHDGISDIRLNYTDYLLYNIELYEFYDIILEVCCNCSQLISINLNDIEFNTKHQYINNIIEFSVVPSFSESIDIYNLQNSENIEGCYENDILDIKSFLIDYIKNNINEFLIYDSNQTILKLD